MRICPKCGNVLMEDAQFCTLCGAKLTAAEKPAAPQAEPVQNTNTAAPEVEIPEQAAPQGTPAGAAQPNYQQYQQPYTTPVYTADPADHTAEYEAKDISDNKVVAMLPYLMGAAGVVIASLVGAVNSPYTMFHVRQGLKFIVLDILAAIVTALLCWTVIVPIVGGIFIFVLFVVKIICFVQVCKGKAVEAPIIRSIGFLK